MTKGKVFMRQPPGRAQRRGGGERKPREERWSELIEVATEVFSEKGYEAASLQDIADRLGMLKGSLYYYIHSKEDILFDVISSVHQEGLSNIESLAAGEGDALQRLRNVIIGHIDYECRNLTKTAVFLHELQALAPERQAEIIGGEHAYRGVFRNLIEAGQKEGLIPAGVDPKLAALWILGSLNWVYRWFRPGGEFTARQIGEQFADMTIRGLATPAALSDLPDSGVPAGMDKRPRKSDKAAAASAAKPPRRGAKTA
jgi:TetR/AcrR family transcriptional regulator, cholesterol catabolism regulator